MKQKLLIFHPYLATYRIDLYNKLSIDYDVKVLLTGAPWELDSLGFNLEGVNAQANFEYQYYRSSMYLGRHPISLVFYKAIKEFNPDLVIAHEYGINTLAAIALKHHFKYKLFVTCDDNAQMAKEYSWKRKWLRSFVVSRIDGLITVSTSTQSYLQDLYKHVKCRFLYFPIIQDDCILHNKVIKSEDIANHYIEHYKLQGKHLLLFVGRLEQVKCIDNIIQAYNNCNRNNCVLIIVGEGSLKSSLINQVKNLNLEKDVIFTGFASGKELYAWYNIADTFILASNREAFGAVVNEALVSGCRCIVSDHCGAHTLISSENGVTFESGNMEQLQNCLQQELTRNKKQQVSSLMPQSFKELYSGLLFNLSI